MSGGIDSLVAAYILKQKGHRLFGIHFFTGYETDTPVPENANSDYTEDGSSQKKRDAERNRLTGLAEQLGIEIHFLNLSKDFQEMVVDYFVHTYLQGQTPNPCLICNPAIKFGKVLEFAIQLGADSLSTGHYARIRTDKNKNVRLFRGADSAKDQSYFLAFLTPKQLSRACFPLGDMHKEQIQEIAEQNDLQPVFSKESQDVCFIRNESYAGFLRRQPGFVSRPGPIEDSAGNVIGKHDGLHLFTVGQRRGINCPAEKPWYVLKIDYRNNRLIVGLKNQLLKKDMTVKNVNWIRFPEQFPCPVHVQIRYRNRPSPGKIFSGTNDRTVKIEFETGQSAITPGQGAVFYQNNEVIGGGFIC